MASENSMKVALVSSVEIIQISRFLKPLSMCQIDNFSFAFLKKIVRLLQLYAQRVIILNLFGGFARHTRRKF